MLFCISLSLLVLGSLCCGSALVVSLLCPQFCKPLSAIALVLPFSAPERLCSGHVEETGLSLCAVLCSIRLFAESTGLHCARRMELLCRGHKVARLSRGDASMADVTVVVVIVVARLSYLG